jgi:predicted O-methyltransferase YrrM
MTSSERVYGLLKSIEYISKNNIHGELVECGVWRGGSSMAMAYMLRHLENYEKELFLFDTFAGMTAPKDIDIELNSGLSAKVLLRTPPKKNDRDIWCIASYEDVSENMKQTGYPMGKIHLIKGDILKTLKLNAPKHISLLRLDTDWYESTKCELEILYPRLVSGGICIIDDYGHWAGAKKAVDEYFLENNIHPLLIPIDYSGRIFVKR